MASSIRGFLPDPTPIAPDNGRKPPSSTSQVMVVAREQEPETLTYKEAITKGYRLLSMLSAPSVTPTIFTTIFQLGTWGYDTRSTPINLMHDHFQAFRTITPEFRVNAMQVCSRHEISCTRADGTRIPSTSAFFTNSFDAFAGVIVAGSNFNPEYAIGDYMFLKGEALPSLRHWSDVVYLQSRFLEGGISNLPNTLLRLKAVVRHSIENRDTNMIIHGIVKDRLYCEPHEFSGHPEATSAGCSKCWELLKWPGVSFDNGSLQYVALLGTPNGRGVAFLLKQHSELAGKEIKGVTIWCDTNKQVLKPSLVFWIGDQTVRK